MSGGTGRERRKETRRRPSRALVALAFVVATSLLAGPAGAVEYTIVPGGPPVTVTVAVAGDTANATFNGTAGQRVSLEMTGVTIGTSACCGVKVSLVRPDGRTITTATVGTNGGFIDAQTLPQTGVYTFLVDPQSTNTGDMTLTAHDVPPDVAGTIAPGGAPVTVSVGTPGQNASLTFSGAAGQRVSLDVSNVSVGSTSCCTTRVLIAKPDGKTLASTTVGTNGGFLDTQTLPTTGTYTIAVDPQNANAGDATLVLYDVPADATATIAPGGAPVSVGTSVPGQNAAVTFTGSAGQRVSLAIGDVTFGSTSCCTTRVSIVKPDGKTLASTTVGTTGGFLDAQTLPSSGVYTILVDPQNAATGGATLTLYDVPADTTGAIVAGGAAVTVTTTTPGQNAALTFSGTSGQRVSAEIGPTCCSTRIVIVKPNGQTLATANFGMSGGFFDTVVLPSSGTYTLVVDPQAAGIGDVTVRLHAVPADAVAGTVADGSAVTVATTVPGQNGVVTFPGTAGQRISVQIGPSCCSGRVSLLRPNGTSLVSGTFGTFGGFLDTATLTVSGTWSVMLDVLGPATGSMTVKVYDVPADVTASLTADGTPVAVATTTPGQDVRATFTGTVGQRVSLKVGPTCCSLRVSITRPDGQTLVAPMFVGVAGGFLDTQTLPTSGTYTVDVDYQTTATGSVTLALFSVPADVTATITAGGSPVTVTMGTPGQNARVTFSGVTGQRVSLGMSNVTIGSSSFFGTKVSMLRPDGTTLVAPVNVGTSGGAIDTQTLPADGTYTILVDPQDANTGSMTLTLHDVPSDATAAIVPGGPPVTVTMSTPGQNARVTFDATAGQRVSLDISGVTVGTSTCCSVRVSILDPVGATVVFPLTMGTNGGFIDSTALTATGTYIIFVDPQGSETGNVTLTLFDVPGDAVVSATPGGPAATVTTTTPGQNGRITFAGTAGQRVSARITPICCISRISVLNPDGTPLVPATSFGTGGGFIDAVTLPVDGAYELFVDPFGDAVGSVTATVYNVPPDVTATATFGSTTTVTTTAPGQNAAVTFTGTGGDGVRLTLGPFNCCGTLVTVRDPDGVIVAGTAAFNPDGGSMFMRLPVSGTYTILLDYQGANVGSVHLRLEVDNTAPTPPVLTLNESSNDSHIIGATFYYRPTGAGGTVTVGATSSDAGGLSKVTFPGLAGGFSPTGATDDFASPFSQIYTWTTGATFSNPSNTVLAVDRVGNTSSTPFGVVRDPDPPVTSDNTAAIGFSWKNTNVVVNFSANDGSGAGPARTHFTTDGSTPTDTSPIGAAVTLTADGVYTVKYFSVDNVSNVEAVRTAGTQVRIDKTPPSSAALDPLPTVIKNGQVLTGSGSDALSGVASITYLYCAGGSCTPSTPIGTSTTGPTYPFTWSGMPADGTYQLVARVTDAAGNTLDSAKRTVTIDNTAPNTTITGGPTNPTNQTTASFSFTSTEAGSTFECRLDSGAWSSCTTPRSYSGLTEGSHTFDVRATDPVGNTDQTPATRTWTVDLTAPETTITANPTDPSSGTVSFSFTSSESGSTFQCRIDGAAFASCTSPKPYTGLTTGSHTFEVRATDAAGNADASVASFAWTVDATPPDTTITSFPVNPTNQTTASFGFTSTEAGTFQCKLDTGAFAACTSPHSYTGLSDGSHTVQVRAIDGVGNVDPTPATYTWTVDTGAPNTTITASPLNPTNQTTASFSFTATEGGSTFQCRLDGAAFAGCTSSHSYTGLSEGSHTFEVRAIDSAGNIDASPASFTWVVDTTAPETAITASPNNPTNATSASFSFTSSETGSTFQCRLDGAAFAACTSSKSYSGLAEGVHTFEVSATDPAGNTDPDPASFTWTIDTTAPQTTVDSGPISPTNATSASFTFSASEPGSTFQCRRDGAAFAACTSGQSYTGLADGSHTFEVRATDPAGNTDSTPATHTWTVDTGPPNTTITASPSDPTNATSASFSFTSTETGSSFECRLDASAFASCTSSQSYTGLSEGSHTFEVRATDPAGNTDASAASFTWTVDTTAPETTITVNPSDPSAPNVSFSFTSSETGSTFECRVDASAFASCTSSKSYSGLADGSHTFEVRATDPAGNGDASAAAFTWTVDAVSPDTIVDDGPTDPTSSTSATFSFSSSEAGSSFECKLDAGAFASCTSGQSYTGLADGSHTFEVRATDAVGNTDPTAASFAWTVDTTGPQTSIVTGPGNPTSATSAAFEFSSSEPGATFECKLDAGSFASCTSGQSYTGLADGSHTFEVRATDPAGNTDSTPATYSWTVDTAGPETTVDAGPANPTNQTSASFWFSADEPGSTFECKLDTGVLSSCTSPTSYSGLSAGAHTFEVRATDSLGNTDSTPATWTWTVDLTAPETTVDTGPDDPTNQTAADFTFSSSETGSGFQCKLDGGAFTACSSPQSYSGLAPGSHTFAVRATDPAGNTDGTPATYAWVVDVAEPETAISSGPSGATNSTSATFEFTSNEAGSTFECKLDTGVFASCTSPVPYSGLAEGVHVFEVRATDAAGNTDTSPGSRTWTVDVTAPAPPAITSPADGSANNTGTVALSGTAEPLATVEVFDGAASQGTASANSGGAWSKALTGVADGSHTYTATARDAAGNVSLASNAVTVTVDTTAPNTTITTGPLGATASTSASFTFNADDPAATFECALDGAAFTPCTSSKTYTGLAETSHTFQVRATDAAGNTDPSPASRGWTVDVTAPAAPVITGPADGSTNNTGNVTVSGTAESGTFVEVFEGAVSKGGTVASGGVWSKPVTGVGDGPHTYTAVATDAAGNASPSSNAVTVTVDTVQPQTAIDSSPTNLTTSTDATFEFSSSESGSTFACRLDAAAFAPCTSQHSYTSLADGAHTFEVRATDGAGNTDSTPASFTWTVDTTAPETTIDSGPTDPTTETTASFFFSASEAGSTFECSLDSATFATCTNPESYSGLAPGSHTFEVRATDQAGNADSTTATYAWTVT